MGFVENKKAQVRTEAQIRQSVMDEKAAMQRRVAEEKEFHLKRNQQATTIRRDSGVGSLVKALGEILAADKLPIHYIDGSVGTRSRGVSKGPDYDMRPFFKGRHIEYPNISLTDPDSTLDKAVWDVEYLGKQDYLVEHRKAEVRFLGVETSPDGDVVFHTHIKEIIQEQVWRSNLSALEEALEKAFNKPGTHKYVLYYSSSKVFGPRHPLQ